MTQGGILALFLAIILTLILFIFYYPAGTGSASYGEFEVVTTIQFQGLPGIGYQYELLSVNAHTTSVTSNPLAGLIKAIELPGERVGSRGNGKTTLRIAVYEGDTKIVDSGYVAQVLASGIGWINPMPQTASITAYIRGLKCGHRYRVKVEFYDERGNQVYNSPRIIYVECGR